MSLVKTKTFNGERYLLEEHFPNKSKAKARAEKGRGRGYNARVIEVDTAYGKRYAVYLRVKRR